MINVNALRGMIHTNFRSIAACAEASGISKNSLYRILNGKKTPNIDEIRRIGKACDLSAEDIRRIFLS